MFLARETHILMFRNFGVAAIILSLMALSGCSTAVEWGKKKALDKADEKGHEMVESAASKVDGLDPDASPVDAAKAIVSAAVKDVLAGESADSVAEKYGRITAEFFGGFMLMLVSGWLGGRKPKAALIGMAEAINKTGSHVKPDIAAKTASMGIGTWLHNFLKSHRL